MAQQVMEGSNIQMFQELKCNIHPPSNYDLGLLHEPMMAWEFKYKVIAYLFILRRTGPAYTLVLVLFIKSV